MLRKRGYSEFEEPEFLKYLSCEDILSGEGSSTDKKIRLKNNLMIARGLMLKDYGTLGDAKDAVHEYYSSIIRNFLRKSDAISAKVKSLRNSDEIDKLAAEKEKLKQKIFGSSRKHGEYLRRIREIESIDKLL